MELSSLKVCLIVVGVDLMEDIIIVIGVVLGLVFLSEFYNLKDVLLVMEECMLIYWFDCYEGCFLMYDID